MSFADKSHRVTAANERRRGARGKLSLRTGLRAGAATLASGTVIAAASLAMAAPAGAATLGAGQHHARYTFFTLDNQNDPTFNQLLGINNRGVIAGYFGSGAAGHPNKGYRLLPPYGQGDYVSENFTGSAQTQVTGLNDGRTQVGFFAPTNTGTDANFGWYTTDNGHSFHEITVPNAAFGSPPVTQLLGVNDFGKAVGFYTDANGNNHGFVYKIHHNRFAFTKIHGATSVTDVGINNLGDVTGFFTNAGGTVESFLKYNGHTIFLNAPGASATTAFGVNDFDEVVGVYTVGSGTSATMHGFTWTPERGFRTVDDPNGVGTTTVNGVNDRGDLVGFYVDSAGNTDGMLAIPHH
jgi:hypothetical protein